MKNWLWFLPLMLFVSCFKEDPEKFQPYDKGDLLILNEGNFQWGNASIDLYNLDEWSFSGSNIFETENGRPLGDILQSALLFHDKIWLVVNNSGRIEVLNFNTYKLENSITGLNSPRYLCPIDDRQLLVSDLYDDSLSVLDAITGTVTKKIGLKGWTEQMLRVGENIWVTNPNTYKIYSVDRDSLYLKDSVEIGFGSFAVKEGNDGNVWIATKGDKILGIPSEIHAMNAQNQTFTFSKEIGTEAIIDFYLDGEDAYYIYDNKLYHFSLNAPENHEVLYDQGGSLYAVEVYEHHIFLCDAVDYVQKGKVVILDKQGNETQSFRVGRIPNGFLFIP